MKLTLTSSRFNAETERPSPPDQSWSCFTERQKDSEKKEVVHFRIRENMLLRGQFTPKSNIHVFEADH